MRLSGADSVCSYIDPPYQHLCHRKILYKNELRSHSTWIAVLDLRRLRILAIASIAQRIMQLTCTTIDDYAISSRIDVSYWRALSLRGRKCIWLQSCNTEIIPLVVQLSNRVFRVNHEYGLFFSRLQDRVIFSRPYASQLRSSKSKISRKRDKNGLQFLNGENFRREAVQVAFVLIVPSRAIYYPIYTVMEQTIRVSQNTEYEMA